jgi:hypothetical protein
MTQDFNQNVGATVRRLTFATAAIATALFVGVSASNAVAASPAGLAQATAPASTQVVGGQVTQVGPKILRIKRARRINAAEGIGGASCWVTYEKWGTVFYGTCPY